MVRPPNSHRAPKGDLPFSFILSTLVLTILFILVFPARWKIPGAETSPRRSWSPQPPRRALDVDCAPWRFLDLHELYPFNVLGRGSGWAAWKLTEGAKLVWGSGTITGRRAG